MSLLSFVESRDKKQLAEKLEEIKGKKELFERSQQGHSPLDLAAILGQHEIVQLLLEYGAELSGANKSGYTALHYSAAWGQHDCLALLADKGADCFSLTRHKETPKDMAVRYGQSQCVDLLKCYEQYKELKNAVSKTRLTLSDIEKITGRWNKDDRSKVTAICNEKSNWLEKRPIKETKMEEIQLQKEEFDQRIQPYLNKLT